MARAEEHGAKHVEAARAQLAGAAGPVLDLGCGEGIFNGVSPAMVGVDRALDAARRARRGVVADLERLPFRDGATAGAVLVNVLHAVRDPRRALEELARTMAPGARGYLKNDWYKSPHGRGAALRRELSRWTHYLAYAVHRLFAPGRFLSRRSERGSAICPHCAIRTLRAAGLEVARAGRYVLLLARR